MLEKEITIQRQYYANTAQNYDTMHNEPEHVLALYLLAGYVDFYNIKSILDVGAGTGTTLLWLKKRFPELTVVGIEPVQALRQQGHNKGLSSAELRHGDACQLPFADASFDLVCEFAVLHHIKHPDCAVREMSRVASRMICISDCNFMGQGSIAVRLIKRGIFTLGLWPLANWIKTKGKGYSFGEEDGLAYSYSVFQNLSILQQDWPQVSIIPTKSSGGLTLNPMIAAEQLLLVGIKNKSLFLNT